MVNIDGQLLGDSVQVAEDYCRQALAAGKHVRVHLRDVSDIDDRGRDFLLSLARQGVVLDASGVYTSHLVKSVRRSLGAAH